MKTCMAVGCELADDCCLVGGCVRTRFPHHFETVSASAQEELKPESKALNGTKPGRTNRDPVTTPRKRKPLNGPNPLRRRR